MRYRKRIIGKQLCLRYVSKIPPAVLDNGDAKNEDKEEAGGVQEAAPVGDRFQKV